MLTKNISSSESLARPQKKLDGVMRTCTHRLAEIADLLVTLAGPQRRRAYNMNPVLNRRQLEANRGAMGRGQSYGGWRNSHHNLAAFSEKES